MGWRAATAHHPAQTALQDGASLASRPSTPPYPARAATARAAPGRHERTRLRRRRQSALAETLRGYGFLLPALALLFTFHLGPVLYAAFLSLHDARIVADMWRPGRLVGLANYAAVLGSPDFQRSLANTVWYVLGVVPPAIFLSLLIASLLNRRMLGRDAYRTAYFVPYVTSTVAAALVWDWVFQPRVGLANWLFSGLGLPMQRWTEEPRPVGVLLGQFLGVPWPELLGGPSLALLCIALIQIWHSIGFDTVVMLAGLTAIPPEQYEAARIDGASRWALFRHITIPLLSPTLFFLLVTSTIRAFQAFNWFYVIYNGNPPPDVKVVTIFLFQTGFQGGYRTGLAAAVGFVLFGIILALTLVQMAGLRRRVHYGEA